jgi:hypothetical protein
VAGTGGPAAPKYQAALGPAPDAAGLAGALIGWGIPEEDADFYEGEVKTGRHLVTVDCGDRGADDARAVLLRSGGFDRATAGR